MAHRTSSTPTESQFISIAFTGLLKDHGFQISMDECYWRVTYWWNDSGTASNTKRHIWMPTETVSAAQQGFERYVTFYNERRLHTALDDNRRMSSTSIPCLHSQTLCRQ